MCEKCVNFFFNSAKIYQPCNEKQRKNLRWPNVSMPLLLSWRPECVACDNILTRGCIQADQAPRACVAHQCPEAGRSQCREGSHNTRPYILARARSDQYLRIWKVRDPGRPEVATALPLIGT